MSSNNKHIRCLIKCLKFYNTACIVKYIFNLTDAFKKMKSKLYRVESLIYNTLMKIDINQCLLKF